MNLTILGSGTVVPDPDSTCAAYHLEAGALSILLDCGPGAVHRMARFGVDWTGLTHILLSHFHTDHIGDLPGLFFAFRHASRERTLPLTVLGPVGTRERLSRMASAFDGSILDPGFPLEIRELAGDESLDLDADTRLHAIRTPHTENSIGYRIETPDASFGYTGDTGYPGATGDLHEGAGTPSGPALGRFFRGVDILLAECSLPDSDSVPMHLTPTTAAALARAAAPKTLVLSHIYPILSRDALPARVRDAGWTGRLVIARDGVRVVPITA